MPMISRGLLQTATVLTKTTPTLMGAEIKCGGYDTITLFLDYVKGDETGLIITPYVMYTAGGTAYQDQSWSAAGGAKTTTANTFYMTASGNHFVTMDVTGVEFIKFMQSCADGTPLGTVAATYTLKGGVA